MVGHIIVWCVRRAGGGALMCSGDGVCGECVESPATPLTRGRGGVMRRVRRVRGRGVGSVDDALVAPGQGAGRDGADSDGGRLVETVKGPRAPGTSNGGAGEKLAEERWANRSPPLTCSPRPVFNPPPPFRVSGVGLLSCPLPLSQRGGPDAQFSLSFSLTLPLSLSLSPSLSAAVLMLNAPLYALTASHFITTYVAFAAGRER